MRGRRPKPAELKEAQGNPGRRRILRAAPVELVDEVSLPFPVTVDAKRIYDLVAPGLQNMLRTTDAPAFWRYCDTMAEYWRVTEKLRLAGGPTYKAKMGTGEIRYLTRGEFTVQERLARRLDSLEDRFGLTPMARQQYMLALSRGSMGPAPELPLQGMPQTVSETDDVPVTGAIH